MNIEKDKVVTFHYTLTNDAGETLDSSEGREPLPYLHGHNGIIPGLEKELEGKQPGDRLRVTVAPADAYGEINPEMIQMVPREAFSGVDEIRPGMQFQAQAPDGSVQVVVVKDVTEEGVLIDANHPLAGQTLHFDVEIAEVRDATPEELEHGHVH